MKIIRLDKLRHTDLYRRSRVIKEMSLKDFDDRLKIVEAAKHSNETMEKWFKAIGVQYDTLHVTKANVLYTVGDVELTLTELSHGERYLLFLIACKVTNDVIIAESLLEILGYRLRRVLYEQLRDYDNLIIATLNAYPPEYLIQYKVERV